MKLESLNCNNCGAPLEVPETANFVTCNHCQAKLAIRRSDSSTTTEQLDKIEAKQDELLEKVSSLQRQNRVAQIDRQWDRDRQGLLLTDKHGNRHEPNATMAVLVGIFATVVGLIWTVSASSIVGRSPFGGSSMFPLFGIVFIVFGIGIAVYQFNKAGEFRAAKQRYHRARRAAAKTKDDKTQRSPRDLSAELDRIRTPSEYLEQLGEADSIQRD